MLITCTICGDLFTGSDAESICCTPCGHSFHHICLLNWFERVKSCPQCRQKASEKTIVRLYFSLGSSENGEENTADFLRNKVDNLSYQIRMKDIDIKGLKEKNEKFKSQNSNLLSHVKEVEDKIRNHHTVVSSLQDQIKLLKSQCKELSGKKLELEYYRDQVQSLKHVEALLHGTIEKSDEVLKNNKLNHEHLVRSLKSFKREVEEMRKKIKFLKEDRDKKEKKIVEIESKLSGMTKDYQQIITLKKQLEEDLEYSEREVNKWKNNCHALQKTSEAFTKSDPKSRLIQRLILEEPAPANINVSSLLDTTTYDLSTPSPVEAPKVRSFMNKVKSHKLSSQAFPSSSSASSSSNSNSSNIGNNTASSSNLIRTNRFTLDPLEKIKVIQQCKSKSDELYDGFGGHSKIDVFPQPKLNNGLALKKKKVSNVSIPGKKRKADENFPKISSFLKTYDLTGDDSD